MALRQLHSAHRPISLIERTQRLNEKMIATALLGLEDWSPLRRVEPAAPAHAPSGPSAIPDPPPIRWLARDPANGGDTKLAG